MSRGDRCEEIPSAILGGITSAFKTYERWTLEDKWLADAPELFVSVEVARKLKKAFPNGHVDMESSIRGALSDAGAKARGRPRKTERRDGRCDILLSRNNRRPWCAVEIKSPVWGTRALTQDIERVRDLIRHHNKNGSSLSCGAIAFYSDRAKPKRKHATAREALEGLGKSSCKLAKELVRNDVGISVKLHKSAFHRGENDDGWQAFCLFFRMRKVQSTE